MIWFKSSFCNADQPMCVEVARVDDRIYLRDSRGDITRYTPDEFDKFISGVKAGEFDDLI